MFQYATKVKALIDAGTCASITTSTVCGSSSTSSAYYETFVYNNKRVVISSGVPNHNAEYNQTLVNPNTRCKYRCDKKNSFVSYSGHCLIPSFRWVNIPSFKSIHRCCVFRPAFGSCAHPKAGRNLLSAVFQPFLFISKLFQ